MRPLRNRYGLTEEDSGAFLIACAVLLT
jgi:hypothetical protein